MKKHVIRRIINRIRKMLFKRHFRQFDISSGIGTNGVGGGCILNGTTHISIGKDCFFGKGTELTAIKNHFEQSLNPVLNIGNHVRCVGGCRITCASNIVLENDVLLGP